LSDVHLPSLFGPSRLRPVDLLLCEPCGGFGWTDDIGVLRSPSLPPSCNVHAEYVRVPFGGDERPTSPFQTSQSQGPLPVCEEASSHIALARSAFV
jgi:hypothetical protein